jgi:flagellar protein FlaG
MMSNTEPTSAMAAPAQNQSAAAQAKLPQPASVSARPRSSGDSAAELSARTNDLKAEATKAAQAVEVKQDRSVALITTVAQELDEAITVLNESLAKTPTRAMISKDETLNRFVVKIADKESGEIVREIPSEALLKFARQLKELKGILFDKHT